MTITIKAIYQNGVIRPLEVVDLQENEQIIVQIKHLEEKPSGRPQPLSSLRGIWKDLPPIPDKLIEEATQMWERGLEKQIKLLGEALPDE